MLAVLARLGADPWDDGFYDVPERRVFVLERLDVPATITTRSPKDVLRVLPEARQRGNELNIRLSDRQH